MKSYFTKPTKRTGIAKVTLHTGIEFDCNKYFEHTGSLRKSAGLSTRAEIEPKSASGLAVCVRRACDSPAAIEIAVHARTRTRTHSRRTLSPSVLQRDCGRAGAESLYSPIGMRGLGWIPHKSDTRGWFIPHPPNAPNSGL